MKKQNLFWLTLSLLMGTCSFAADLTAYTEEWPPYNYQGKDAGEVQGVSTDVLRALCKEARLQCEFRLVPWARAYKTALEQAGTLVYTTARKPEREHDFIWLGPIAARTTWLYVRKALAAPVKTTSDLAALRIGVVRDEAAVTDLAALGVPAEALKPQASNSDVLRLLQHGALDAMVDTELGMAWNLRSLGMSLQMVSRRFKVSDAGAYYFALNPGTSPAVVDALQQAFIKLQKQGRLEHLLHTYLEDINPN